MKLYFFVFFVFLSIFSLTLKAQSISYSYDDSGNCIGRSILLTRSSSVGTFDESEEFFTEDKTINVKIYPNPTKGLLKVEMNNYDFTEKGVFEVYDLQGRLLIKNQIADSIIELDLSNYQDGIYILVLRRNGIGSEWKIIKTN